MDRYFLLLALPSAIALVAGFFPRTVRRFPNQHGTVIALLLFGGAAVLLTGVSREGGALFSIPWAPGLGVDFALRMTPFTAWFGVLVFFLGGCIHLYASSYFAKDDRLPGLLVLLGLFTSAMLGVIWSDNFYLLFLFWEATSLLSFLLVGFHHDREKARENASQALLITMAGGAALLVGLVLLHQNTGTASISRLLEGDLPPAGTAAVLLIILGAMTKSAQWPFHFWLPNAMVGPTPVSAYLHSATMVKAGVFLLGTLAPVMKGHPLWTPVLAIAGILTVVTSVLRGSRETDLKALLACTTLAALGFLTVLAGIGTPSAMLGFVIFLTAHALYKAPLFLAAGNLEKRFGTRELPALRGAARHLPLTGTVVVVSALSLIGFAPLPGFLGKEYLLKATWAYSPLLAIAVAVSAAGVLALGFKIVIPLVAKSPGKRTLSPLPAGMSVATLLPALAALCMVASLPLASHGLLGPAATSLGAAEDASYKYWYGWTPALLLGLGALALSILVGWVMTRPSLPPVPAFFGSFFNDFFDGLIAALRRLATGVAGLLEGGKLTTHLAIMLTAIGALSFVSIDLRAWDRLPLNWGGDSWIFIGLAPLLIIATIAAGRAERTLPLLISLGFVGLFIALLFLWFSAPDLALTQLMAETLILFLLAGALAKSRQKRPAASEVPPFFRLIFATLGGSLVTLLILKSMTLEWDHPVSDYFLRESKNSAFGANVVNVILVDFRALDTLGEIIVLAIAALGANAALGAARERAPLPKSPGSDLLRTGSGVLAWFLVPTILWIFWRGHNAPGGGFIAALLAASGIGLGLLCSWQRLTPSFMRKASHRLLVSGLAIALAATLLPLAVGRIFFAGLWLHFDSLHLGTPLLFDLGVFLTVLGFCLNYLRHFHLRTL